LSPGEESKSLAEVQNIYKKLVDINADRTFTVVSFGGGVVSDIAGFVASTYLRGLSFIYISSSLLSQVDASIGGKTGVNFLGNKNQVGVINQPKTVICPLELLNTLPEQDYIPGIAEVVKNAAIKSKEFFHFLEQNIEKIVKRDRQILEIMIFESIKIKAMVVQEDPFENGNRRLLNWGHTIGHAIESNYNLMHGEAISLGMILESKMTIKKGHTSDLVNSRLTKLLAAFGLPTEIDYDADILINAIQMDKKRVAKMILLPVVTRIGSSECIEYHISDIASFLTDLQRRCHKYKNP
jgi:3-dehydroquinate synthase